MTNTQIKEAFYGEKAAEVVANLNSRGFEAFYCPDSKAAVEKALSLIPQGAVCGWGGSMSIEETGLLAKVKENFKVIDRDTAANGQERTVLMRRIIAEADVFLTSFNAVSKDGTVVNIDGNGNRVAAITFGPSTVIALVGMNKIVESEQAAVERAKTVAAPKNAIRFGKKACDAPSLCNITQILTNGGKGRIKVILTGEELGF